MCGVWSITQRMSFLHIALIVQEQAWYYVCVHLQQQLTLAASVICPAETVRTNYYKTLKKFWSLIAVCPPLAVTYKFIIVILWNILHQSLNGSVAIGSRDTHNSMTSVGHKLQTQLGEVATLEKRTKSCVLMPASDKICAASCNCRLCCKEKDTQQSKGYALGPS